MQLFPLIQTDTPSQHWSNPSTVVDPAISFAAAFELLASPITRNELELSALEPKEPTSETEEPIDSQSQENPAQPEDQAFSDIEMAPPVATHLHVREPKEAVESKAAFPSQASLGMQLSANATLGAAKTASTRGSDSISPNVETTLPARAFVAGTSSITHANPAIAQSETAIKNSKEDATGTQATTLGLVRSSANPISAIIAAGLRPLAQSTQGITLTDAQVNNLTLSPSQASHSTPRDATGAHFQQTNIPPVQPASGLEPSAEVQMRVEISQASTTATRASQRLQPDTHAHNPLLMQLLNKPTASTPQTAEQITSGTSTPPSEEHTAPPHRGTVAALQQTTAPLDAHARRERHFDIHQHEVRRQRSGPIRRFLSPLRRLRFKAV